MEMEHGNETGLVPGTTSNILWHFTGGPPEIDGKRAKEQKKPDDEAFRILNEILRSGLLKTSKETIQYTTGEGLEPVPVHTFYCCCVAEIPIQHLRYHAEWYGKFALGFHRENLTGKYRFRPVQYAFDHDDWVIRNAETLRRFVEGVFGYQKEIVDAILKALEASSASTTEEERKRLIEFVNWFIPTPEALVDILSSPTWQLRFIKSFNEKDFGTIYCEREWRKIDKGDSSKPESELFEGKEEGLDFKPQDVCFIVCPRPYAKELALKIRDDDDFKKYFGIPVVAFEDLLEH